MDRHKEPYIEQPTSEDAFYTKLGRQTLDEVQRLSGTVWTDYNAHDPGVTLADTANYALTELDYKLGFPPADYLAEQGGTPDFARFGLFPPVDVYTTSPVTEDDWRRMLLAEVPGLAGVSVHCNPESGGYTVHAVPAPFTDDSGGAAELIAAAFSRRRNLCEWLEKVEMARPDLLDFEAEFDIDAGEEASTVLARVYRAILYSLSDRAVFHTPGTQSGGGLSPDDFLEGSENGLRVTVTGRLDTEYRLHEELRGVKGVRSFRTCFLKKDGVVQTRFPENASLRIPSGQSGLSRIHIYLDRTEQTVDSARFTERLKSFCLTPGNATGRGSSDVTGEWSVPDASWRDISGHYPLASDFPACYCLHPDTETPSSFEAYTRLYDRIITDGLAEATELPRLLSLADEDFPYDHRTLRLKSRYLDFLDSLYGVESHPAWLSEDNGYGETAADTLRRRMRFLRAAARLTRDRARARDISVPDGNAPAVKGYFCLLLGLDPDDGHTVSNVLPSHNLRLSERGTEDAGIVGRIDSLLIDERMMRPENVHTVEFQMLAKDEEGKRREYAFMRAALPFFNDNRITGDLFRGGTGLDNYKIVETDENTYMLMYRHREHGGWTNLGQDTDPGRLARLANILRRFLRELNRRSETLYVVEPVLADSSRPFGLILVLPSWTYRFHSPRFREKCRELLRGIIPAHLSGKVCWLGEKDMRQFELCYYHLMRTFNDTRLAGYRGDLLKVVDILTERAEYTQSLDDTD